MKFVKLMKKLEKAAHMIPVKVLKSSSSWIFISAIDSEDCVLSSLPSGAKKAVSMVVSEGDSLLQVGYIKYSRTIRMRQVRRSLGMDSLLYLGTVTDREEAVSLFKNTHNKLVTLGEWGSFSFPVHKTVQEVEDELLRAEMTTVNQFLEENPDPILFCETHPRLYLKWSKYVHGITDAIALKKKKRR